MDLTQTSYSTVPSVDIELGDKASDHSQSNFKSVGGDGLVAGVKTYFDSSIVTSRIMGINGSRKELCYEKGKTPLRQSSLQRLFEPNHGLCR